MNPPELLKACRRIDAAAAALQFHADGMAVRPAVPQGERSGAGMAAKGSAA